MEQLIYLHMKTNIFIYTQKSLDQKIKFAILKLSKLYVMCIFEA